MQQYVKNGSRAIRGRVFPEYVCIEDVDKIISSVQRAPEEAAGRGEPGKHLTASETRFTPIDRPTASAMNGKRPGSTHTQSPILPIYLGNMCVKLKYFGVCVSKTIQPEIYDVSENFA